MKFTHIEPPRSFKVGHSGQEISLSHVADLELGHNEQVTLKTPKGRELDIVRKNWGYYVTPSLNGRLKSFGWRSALVASGDRRFVLLAAEDQLEEFHSYLKAQDMKVIAWLDEDELVLANQDPEAAS